MGIFQRRGRAGNRDPKPLSPRRRTIRQLWRENEWVYGIFGFMLGILVWPLVVTWMQQDQIGEFLANLVPEAFGIVFTVLIIDRLDLIRENRLIREQLIRQMQSRDNRTALQAVEELRVLNYLSNGELQGHNLRGANLENANLYQADLRFADLINANLTRADLYEANLEDAKVEDYQLAVTLAMRNATMPDGSRYDGRFNLVHDFEVMARKNFDLSDPKSIAEYYGVPLDVYLKGQQWAQQNLDALRTTTQIPVTNGVSNNGGGGDHTTA